LVLRAPGIREDTEVAQDEEKEKKKGSRTEGWRGHDVDLGRSRRYD